MHPVLLELTPLPLGDAGQVNGEDLAYSRRQDPGLLSLQVQMFYREVYQSGEHSPCSVWVLHS